MLCLRNTQARVSDIEVQGRQNAIANTGKISFYVKDEKETVEALIRDTQEVFRTELQYTDSISLEIEEGDPVKSRGVYRKISERDHKEPYAAAVWCVWIFVCHRRTDRDFYEYGIFDYGRW